MLSVGTAVSGWGVMTRTTLHVLASRPAAMTRRTTSLDVKMPAIFLLSTPSMTQTAVVRFSRMMRAASRTLVLTPTVAAVVRASRIEPRSGNDILSRRAWTYARSGFDAPASTPPNCSCAPSSAE